MSTTAIDTSALLYVLEDGSERQDIVLGLLGEDTVLSVQVVTESSSVLERKFKRSRSEVRRWVEMLLAGYRVTSLTPESVLGAQDLRERYSLSHWDSLIVAHALENQATVLFAEDMQDGLVVEGTLTIRNPFPGRG
jgi:predicted nucleic acid-binding protein